MKARGSINGADQRRVSAGASPATRRTPSSSALALAGRLTTSAPSYRPTPATWDHADHTAHAGYALPSMSVTCYASASVVQTVNASQNSTDASVLVADIGGTNCRFQLWSVVDGMAESMVIEKIYPTEDYARFDQALNAFLNTKEAVMAPPLAAAFACAGPVKDNCCRFTNISWVVDKAEVERDFNIPCRVLNDFEAIGYGVTQLTEDQILKIHDVPRDEKGPIAVLGPGTGLGEAQLFWDDGIRDYRVQPSEGSHATFAPRGWKQRALQAMVEAERGHCSVERVACGSGLVRIYNFLVTDEQSHRPGIVHMEHPTPASVSQAALDGSDPLAVEALDIFISIVGAEAGHMALRSLASGGVYLAGGILPKVINRATEGGLLDAFLWKASRFYEKVLKHVPLYVVLDEKVGLLGSRSQALHIYQKNQR